MTCRPAFIKRTLAPIWMVLLVVLCVPREVASWSSLATCRASTFKHRFWTPPIGIENKRKKCLFLSAKGKVNDENDSDETTAKTTVRKRRVKRRKGAVLADSKEEPMDGIPASLEPSTFSKEVGDTQPVELVITDLRELVSDRSSDAIKPTTTSNSGEVAPASEGIPKDNYVKDDPLAQLLEDSRRMKALEKEREPDTEQTGEVMSAVRNVVSTVVTADFFVVVIFLFWFLAGVISSSVFNDDAIQIAFNGIFQPLVQPALGILMIAAIASAVIKDDEEAQ